MIRKAYQLILYIFFASSILVSCSRFEASLIDAQEINPLGINWKVFLSC